MSDYDAVYAAVRSRIGPVDAGQIYDSIRRSFDISHILPVIQQEFVIAAWEMQRPSVLFRPALSTDGNQWCALLGEDLATGLAGFGDTPDKAMAAFDQAFWKQRADGADTESGNG